MVIFAFFLKKSAFFFDFFLLKMLFDLYLRIEINTLVIHNTNY